MSSEQAAPAEDSTPALSEDKPRRGWVTFLRDVVVIVLIALLVSFLVKTFLVRSFYIPSASMTQTLEINDRILVDEITPRFGGYDRGDVVVFRDPGGWLTPTAQPERSPFAEGVDWVLSLVGLAAPDSDEHLIKRIIGVPGDHVVCCNPLGQITVNGVPIDETPYLNLPPGKTAPSDYPFDVVVPDDSLWVLGDNRDNSQDSRYNQNQPGAGFVPLENVVGRAFLITWPFDRFGLIDFHHGVFAGVPEPEGRAVTVAEPTLTVERRLLKEFPIVIACDEVGRGALAGPVAVGAAVIDPSRSRKRIPQGLRDSKLVPEPRRADVAARASSWVSASAVGWASSVEIDEVGIMAALGLAALRALADLRAHGVAPETAIVILDGNYDYITPAGGAGLRVTPVIKADRDCASAAAASVIAKVARDSLMTSLHDDLPAYNWARNKGYASPDHRQAISAHGLSAHHRHSWAIADAPTLF